jgi:UDP-N-acetyl-D-mannosaminuronate dehydrogenase
MALASSSWVSPTRFGFAISVVMGTTKSARNSAAAAAAQYVAQRDAVTSPPLRPQANIADCRETPALHIWMLLKEMGAHISYHDAFVPEIKVRRLARGT